MVVKSPTDEFTNKMKEMLPSIEQEAKEPIVNIFAELISSLEEEICKNKYLNYLTDVPDGVDKAEHLSKLS